MINAPSRKGALPVLDILGLCRTLEVSKDEIVFLVPGAMEEINRRMEAIGEAMMQGDAPKVALHAHTIKSTAGTIGADATMAAAAALEKVGRTRDLDQTASKLLQLSEQVRRLKVEVANL